MVGGYNFGSGSSREHAAWAIYDYGFRCVISSFFADIFKNNCLNIGVLPVEVSKSFLNRTFEKIYDDAKTEIIVDLPKQKIKISSIGISEKFEINSYKKDNLLNGYDDIDFLKNMKSQIQDFASKTPF